MQELRKSTQADANQEGKIYPRLCPICNIQTNYIYRIEEAQIKEKADWYRCQCGVVFQGKVPSHSEYDAKYHENYVESKQFGLRSTHAARIYAPLIEELMYGRMMLDVGFNAPNVMDYFKARGWLTWGIDINSSIEGKGNIYRGDFLTYDFQPSPNDDELRRLVDEKKIKRTFDLIWMSHTFEHFNDPIAALNKCYDLLSPCGVLFISTPDIDFINKTGVQEFPHWKKREHYIMWTQGALARELERLGFNVILQRRNFSSRFISWYDIHIIAQKNYF